MAPRFCFNADMKATLFQFGPFDVWVLPVLRDNFNYLVCRAHQAVLVDASDAGPVMRLVEREALQLLRILITHSDHDHVGGCRALQDRWGVQSLSPSVESGRIELLRTECEVISTPGHARVHKVFHFPELGVLFAGDTLINGACGRVIGGTMEQLFASMQTIKSLPDETIVFGGHDYLDDNMAFALDVEPDNLDMQARLDLYRSDPAAAIFVSLAEEKRTNPFLRADSFEAFAALRRHKDCF